MKKPLLALFLLTACSAKNDPSIAIGTPQPECGSPGPTLASCMEFPHLSEDQKKLVFSTLNSESESQEAVSHFLFGGQAGTPAEAELLKLLADGSCQRETTQKSRSEGKVFGDRCHLRATTSFLNESTPDGAKEDAQVDVQVFSDEFASQSHLRKFSNQEQSETNVTEVAPKRLRSKTSSNQSGDFESAAGIKMQFSGGGGGTGEIDTSNEQDIKILTLDIYSNTFMRFQNFSALLHITLKKAEGGPMKLEAYLNNDPIDLGSKLNQKLLSKAESATIRGALSGR